MRCRVCWALEMRGHVQSGAKHSKSQRAQVKRTLNDLAPCGSLYTHDHSLPLPELALCQPQRFQKLRPSFRVAEDNVISPRTHTEGGSFAVPPFQKPNGLLSEFQAKSDSAKKGERWEGRLSFCCSPRHEPRRWLTVCAFV